MWNDEPLIQQPFGISVFGSALMKVPPDSASMTLAVSRTDSTAKEAFAKVRKASQGVTAYLQQARVSEFGSSRITLSQIWEYGTLGRKSRGYAAKIAFNVLLKDLDRTEEVLTGLIEAGAMEVESVVFQTSRLKEVRAEVRRQALEAGREKAENYCRAAGVALGRLLHIEDVDPDLLRGRGEGHMTSEGASDGPADTKAFDPGSITISGAVKLAYALEKS